MTTSGVCFLLRILSFFTTFCSVFYPRNFKGFFQSLFPQGTLYLMVCGSCATSCGFGFAFSVFYRNFALVAFDIALRAIFDRHGLGSNPAEVMLLCPWERHFAIISSAWRFQQAVLNYSHISIKKKKNSIGQQYLGISESRSG